MSSLHGGQGVRARARAANSCVQYMYLHHVFLFLSHPRWWGACARNSSSFSGRGLVALDRARFRHYRARIQAPIGGLSAKMQRLSGGGVCPRTRVGGGGLNGGGCNGGHPLIPPDLGPVGGAYGQEITGVSKIGGGG